MRKFLFSLIHLDPLDAGDHLSQLADGKGEEEGDREPEDVEHREAEEGRLCRHNLKDAEHVVFNSNIARIANAVQFTL